MSAKPPTARPIKGLKLPSDRKSYPPVVWSIVFLIVFRGILALGTTLWTMWAYPGWEATSRIGFSIFIALLFTGVVAALVAIVIRGSIIAPYLLTVAGVLGAQSVVTLAMIDVVFAASSVLLVIFVWTPAAREYGHRMRESRRRGPRLPYRYDGPQPKREDFTAGR